VTAAAPALALLACAALGGSARAQSVEAEGRAEASFELRVGPADPFGPLIVIESIEVVGNTYTAERLIRRALPVKEGERLRAGDPRLRAARFKVLALGYFREVDLRLRKGSTRGNVILSVRVVERGTVVLNRMFFGNTLVTPWWAGLDLTERNFFGSGVGVGGAFVVAGEGDADNAGDQKAFQLRLEDPSLLGGPVGVHGAFHYADASEPYRIAGDPSDGSADNFAAFDYKRVGGRAGATINTGAFDRLTALVRFDAVRANLPDAPTRTLPDGRVIDVDLLLEDGESRVATAGLLFERDTRPDPILPYAGDHLLLLAEVGAGPLGSSYDFTSILGRYERWWQLAPRHVAGHVVAGAVLGDAPLFDRLHVGDIDRMVSPRALGLVVSTTPPFDFFGTGSDEITYGELGGLVEAQYAFRLFRSRKAVYGGDLFVGAGLWTLHATRDLGYDAPDFPVDLLLDAGLRLDTEIGIFELSLANALGRVPL
jgi:outer membrane protein insertion porin family